MRREYDFSEGTRGKHAGKRLHVVGDTSRNDFKEAMTSAGQSRHALTGTAGEYYVCAELCRLGYLALLTPKNNPLFDVVATNLAGTNAISIQVKTRSVSNRQGWKLSSKQVAVVDTPGVPFVVLVNLRAAGLPDFYVYRFSEFAARVNEIFENYIAKPKRSGEPRKDPGFRCFDEKNFTEGDRARMNDWQPIIDALERNGA